MVCKYTQEEFDNAKSNDLLKLECECCGNVFMCLKRYISYELTHDRGRCKYCSVECKNKAHDKKIKTICQNCGKEIEVLNKTYNKSKSKHFFCSHSCSAQYNNKQRTLSDNVKKKISETLKKKSVKKIRICKVCGKEYVLNNGKGSTKSFCSKECSKIYHNNPVKFFSNSSIEKLRTGGLHSTQVQKESRRSKNEIYFCQLCKEYFTDVLHNEPLFNGWDADIILPNEKYAILWNGKWHYEKLTHKHSVSQVQNRDKIKINEIIKYGYKPYIIKDLGKYNKVFVEEEFNKFKNFLKKSC